MTHANETCTICNGTGRVIDQVPYGDTDVPMESPCECTDDGDDERRELPTWWLQSALAIGWTR